MTPAAHHVVQVTIEMRRWVRKKRERQPDLSDEAIQNMIRRTYPELNDRETAYVFEFCFDRNRRAA